MNDRFTAPQNRQVPAPSPPVASKPNPAKTGIKKVLFNRGRHEVHLTRPVTAAEARMVLYPGGAPSGIFLFPNLSTPKAALELVIQDRRAHRWYVGGLLRNIGHPGTDPHLEELIEVELTRRAALGYLGQEVTPEETARLDQVRRERLQHRIPEIGKTAAEVMALGVGKYEINDHFVEYRVERWKNGKNDIIDWYPILKDSHFAGDIRYYMARGESLKQAIELYKEYNLNRLTMAVEAFGGSMAMAPGRGTKASSRGAGRGISQLSRRVESRLKRLSEVKKISPIRVIKPPPGPVLDSAIRGGQTLMNLGAQALGVWSAWKATAKLTRDEFEEDMDAVLRAINIGIKESRP